MSRAFDCFDALLLLLVLAVRRLSGGKTSFVLSLSFLLCMLLSFHGVSDTVSSFMVPFSHGLDGLVLFCIVISSSEVTSLVFLCMVSCFDLQQNS